MLNCVNPTSLLSRPGSMILRNWAEISKERGHEINDAGQKKPKSLELVLDKFSHVPPMYAHPLPHCPVMSNVMIVCLTCNVDPHR